MMEYKTNPELPLIKEDWKGNISVNGRFKNQENEQPASMWTAIKWKFSRNPQSEEKKAENYHLPITPLTHLPEEDAIIWLGHATFLIQVNGVRIITDPVLFDIPAFKRKAPLPCDPGILKEIDYLLISHDHRDHLDTKSVELLLRNNPRMQALTPLNARRLFNSKILKELPLQEAGWWQEYRINEAIRILFVPAKHWGRRLLSDTNKTLWGSFVIIHGNRKIYFAGDTAYGNHFAEIREVLGEMDTCLLPIAAYAPSYMMSRSHMNPEEAWQAFTELGGKTLIPMHYGTFDLSDEPLGEPIRRLREAAAKQECRRHELLQPGM